MKFALTVLPLITFVGVSSAHAQTQTTINSDTVDSMWQTQANMVNELQDMGLVSDDVVASMKVTTLDNEHGMGDFDDNEDYYVGSDRDINEAIQALSQQAQQKEDRLASLAQRLSTQQTIIITNNTMTNVPKYSGFSGNGVLSVRPITSSARMSSGYGYRYIFGKTQFHRGMDFAAPVGTPIYATGNGVVTVSGWGNGYGRHIEIDHGNGVRTRYAHNSANFVKVGDTVYANQHIANVGNTGRSTGPHLHYEVRVNGQAVNPQTYLALAPER